MQRDCEGLANPSNVTEQSSGHTDIYNDNVHVSARIFDDPLPNEKLLTYVKINTVEYITHFLL